MGVGEKGVCARVSERVRETERANEIEVEVGGGWGGGRGVGGRQKRPEDNGEGGTREPGKFAEPRRKGVRMVHVYKDRCDNNNTHKYTHTTYEQTHAIQQTQSHIHTPRVFAWPRRKGESLAPPPGLRALVFSASALPHHPALRERERERERARACVSVCVCVYVCMFICVYVCMCVCL